MQFNVFDDSLYGWRSSKWLSWSPLFLFGSCFFTWTVVLWSIWLCAVPDPRIYLLIACVEGFCSDRWVERCVSPCSPLFIGVSNISASHSISLFLQLTFLDWAFDWIVDAYAFRSSAGDRSLLKLSDSGTCVATRFPCEGTLHCASAAGS